MSIRVHPWFRLAFLQERQIFEGVIVVKYIPLAIMIVVQQLAMTFFMRVARWDIYVSAASAAGIAMVVYFVTWHVLRRRATMRNQQHGVD